MLSCHRTICTKTGRNTEWNEWNFWPIMLSVTLIQRHKNQYKPHSVQYFNCWQKEWYDKSGAQQKIMHNEAKSVVFSVFNVVKRIIINVCICTDKKRQQQRGKNVYASNASCECTDTCFDVGVVGECTEYDITLNRFFSQTMCKIELRNYILNNVICVLHIVPKQNGAFCQRCTQQLQFACICFLLRYVHINRGSQSKAWAGWRVWETKAERKKKSDESDGLS